LPGRLSRGGNRLANNALHRIVLLRMRHREPRTMAYFARRRADGLTDRDIMRCLKRHIANEIYTALINPATDHTVGRQLRAERQRVGIPITVLAATLGVPYQRLRRLEIGNRADPELEQRATVASPRSQRDPLLDSNRSVHPAGRNPRVARMSASADIMDRWILTRGWIGCPSNRLGACN
jgi:hypothetical protein